MAATKARTSIWSATTLTAGAGDTTSSAVDLSTSFGAEVNFAITNGGTGPTVPGQVQIEVSNDTSGTLWVKYGGALVASVTNSAVTSWSIEIPIGIARLRLVAGSNTAQNVTVNADISIVTAI